MYISALVGVCKLNRLQNARCNDKDLCSLINGKEITAQFWNNTDGENPKYSEKITIPLPLYAPQIPHELTWD